MEVVEELVHPAVLDLQDAVHLFIADPVAHLGQDVVRGDDGIEEPTSPLALQDLAHSYMVRVVSVDERIEKAGVEEDQSRGSS